MRWRLRFQLQEIDLPFGSTRLGRGPECPITFEDDLVSRSHAVLFVHHDACSIIDLGSTNGVWVNGQRIESPTILRSTDRIRLGRDELVLLNHVASDPSVSERETGRRTTCPLCRQEHADELVACPSCGLAPEASHAIADFLHFTERTKSGIVRRFVPPKKKTG